MHLLFLFIFPHDYHFMVETYGVIRNKKQEDILIQFRWNLRRKITLRHIPSSLSV